MVGKGVGEGWGTVTDGGCLLTCVLTFGCAHAVRKKGGGGGAGTGAGGRGCACRREQKGKNVPGHPAGCEFIAVQKAVEDYGTEKA